MVSPPKHTHRDPPGPNHHVRRPPVRIDVHTPTPSAPTRAPKGSLLLLLLDGCRCLSMPRDRSLAATDAPGQPANWGSEVLTCWNIRLVFLGRIEVPYPKDFHRRLHPRHSLPGGPPPPSSPLCLANATDPVSPFCPSLVCFRPPSRSAGAFSPPPPLAGKAPPPLKRWPGPLPPWGRSMAAPPPPGLHVMPTGEGASRYLPSRRHTPGCGSRRDRQIHSRPIPRDGLRFPTGISFESGVR